MNRELLKNVIFDQHEIIRRAVIVPRMYEFDPQADYVLTGLRRSGKSTLLYKICQELAAGGADWEQIIFVNFEDERLLEFTAADFNDLLVLQSELSERPGYYFLDEVQNVAGWEKFARRLADMKERVYITGSNAQMLSREIESTLGGRYLSKHISPYCFREYLEARQIDAGSRALASTKLTGKITAGFKEYCAFGGLPEVQRYSVKREYLTGVYQKVVLGDITARYKIRNEYAVRLLLKKTAETVCSEVSYSKLHHTLSSVGLKISKDTVIDYLQYAVSAYLIFPIYNYFAKISEREGHPKYYFSDNGLLNILLSDKSSALLENLLATELSRAFAEVYYLKSAKTGIDIDFYIPERQWAVQAAYSVQGEARNREISSLKKTAAEFPEVRRLFIVTWEEQETIETGRLPIEVVPAYRFLLTLCQ